MALGGRPTQRNKAKNSLWQRFHLFPLPQHMLGAALEESGRSVQVGRHPACKFGLSAGAPIRIEPGTNENFRVLHFAD